MGYAPDLDLGYEYQGFRAIAREDGG
jgi:hypothetical protein